MNHAVMAEHLERLAGNVWLMQRFLNDPALPDHMVALEILGRCNNVEAKVAQIRGEMARDSKAEPEQTVRGNAPKHNVHALGAREPSYRRPQGDGEAA